ALVSSGFRSPAFGRDLLALGVRVLQFLDVELAHLEHGLDGLLRIAVLRIADHLAQRRGHDLPRQTPAILQPAAGSRLAAAGGELVPEVVDLLLRLAVHEHREALAEAEGRPAVHGHERLPIELETRVQHLALGDRALRIALHDADDPRVRDYGGVELDRLLGPVLERDERRDLARRLVFRPRALRGAGVDSCHLSPPCVVAAQAYPATVPSVVYLTVAAPGTHRPRR